MTENSAAILVSINVALTISSHIFLLRLFRRRPRIAALKKRIAELEADRAARQAPGELEARIDEIRKEVDIEKLKKLFLRINELTLDAVAIKEKLADVDNRVKTMSTRHALKVMGGAAKAD